MKAIIQDKYGSLDVLELREIDKPLAKDDEVLVMRLENKPSTLANISRRFGDANININYVYGSGTSEIEQAIYVFHVPDVDEALTSLSSTQTSGVQ